MASHEQLHSVTAKEVVKAADNLGERNCIPLAEALGFDELYINKLKWSKITVDTPASILFKWHEVKPRDATIDSLCDALVQIHRRDLAEAINPEYQGGGKTEFRNVIGTLQLHSNHKPVKK